MTDAATTAQERASRKVRVGKVISNKMQKSIVVAIERRIPHPLYKKYYKRTTTLMAHDEQQAAKIGDVVKVAETRPMSARKRWRLVAIVEKAK
jgi:small subunit ribosomal protein S17